MWPENDSTVGGRNREPPLAIKAGQERFRHLARFA
jgi:hypothetical protein